MELKSEVQKNKQKPDSASAYFNTIFAKSILVRYSLSTNQKLISNYLNMVA
ncbi:hypothetical protein QFZ87_004474 [Bacillus sp. SLBN-46]|nr:hypothetical protein [Bacillus sp. SLBN-46]